MTTPGKLLMISDLEGCAEFDNANPVKVKQTTLLCKTPTFQALDLFLKKTGENNKVVFMGDYFDKGPNVVNSINEIVKLSEGNPGKVHVILGNRDVNKLRFIYEFDKQLKGCPSKIVNPFWKCDVLRAIVAQTQILERMKLIMKDTMGAGPPAYDTTNQIGLKINKIGDGFDFGNLKTVESYFAYVFSKAFNINVSAQINSSVEDDIDLQGDDFEFISNCRKLFQMAKIVIYDSDYKVLLSHAGGFTRAGSFILSNKKYYEDILAKLGEINFDNYYQKIFEAQQALQTAPTEIQLAESATLIEVLEFVNKLLSDSLKFDDAGSPSSSYILLQAMGLTGSPNYYSFIASCALNGGCKLEFNINNELLAKMSESSIKFIASGHQPHCTTVPLIYKQSDVVFIANDTSNGYRPDGLTPLELQNIPLSYIEIRQSEFGCGVCAITPLGKCVKASEENHIKSLSKDGKTDNYYKKLVVSYDDITKVPNASDVAKILKMTGMFQPLTALGGKRKSKKQKGKKNNRKTCRHCGGGY